jgi:hypothetical protein
MFQDVEMLKEQNNVNDTKPLKLKLTPAGLNSLDMQATSISFILLFALAENI